jgi:hypothetical protein
MSEARAKISKDKKGTISARVSKTLIYIGVFWRKRVGVEIVRKSHKSRGMMALHSAVRSFGVNWSRVVRKNTIRTIGPVGGTPVPR